MHLGMGGRDQLQRDTGHLNGDPISPKRPKDKVVIHEISLRSKKQTNKQKTITLWMNYNNQV